MYYSTKYLRFHSLPKLTREHAIRFAEPEFNPVKVMQEGEGYWVVDASTLVR